MTSKVKFSSFLALNLTQFLVALNDNLFKLLLIFFLIDLKGPKESNQILSLAGAIFVIPFLLFASLAGALADRFSKRSIITNTRMIEIFIVALGCFSFAIKSPIMGYSTLFLMATQSTLFSPAKYGIIPEIVSKTKISHYNGIITATTYLAIIFGTFLASFLVDVSNQNYILASSFCLLIAVFGLLFSLKIEKTAPQASGKKVSLKIFSEVFRILARAKKVRYLFTTLILGSYFLFLGAYVQLNIIPFALESLNESQVQGGYLFLMTAIGIGIGSFAAGKLSGKEVELGFVSIAAFGITLILILIFIFQHHLFVVAPLLILLGILGGFYIVPIDAFIQVASPAENRGENVAASNFLSFLGVIVASGLIALFGVLLKLTAAQGFLIVGIATFFVALFLSLITADQVLRMVVAKILALFWKLEVHGIKKVKESKSQLILANRESWIDTLIVMAILPRRIPYIVPIEGRFLKSRTKLYKFFHLIALDIDHFVPLNHSVIRKIKEEISKGNSVCLMAPLNKDSEAIVKEILKEISPSTLFTEIKRKREEKKSIFSQFSSLFKYPIKVTIN